MFPGMHDSKVIRGKTDREECGEVLDGDVLRNCEGNGWEVG